MKNKFWAIHIEMSISDSDLGERFSWTPVNKVTDCGQHVFIHDNSVSCGEVDIYYQ